MKYAVYIKNQGRLELVGTTEDPNQANQIASQVSASGQEAVILNEQQILALQQRQGQPQRREYQSSEISQIQSVTPEKYGEAFRSGRPAWVKPEPGGFVPRVPSAQLKSAPIHFIGNRGAYRKNRRY